MSKPIRILHLSDFHFAERSGWDASPVLNDLAGAIGREVRNDGMTPDLVAITGDLAFSGSKADYQLAREWLDDQLWPALGNPDHDRLLLVPGNHDVDRATVKFSVKSIQQALLDSKSQDAIAEVLRDKDERAPLLRRHSHYLDFLKVWLGKKPPLPWWQRLIEVGDYRLHIAGLDSAWMSHGNEDHGRLLLGRYQINDTIQSEDANKADLRIALLHHPWSYLAEFDAGDAETVIHQRCALVLRGHLHKARSERVVPPDPNRACLELAAGCVYEDSKYDNAYQWIELYPEKNLVRVHFRTWRDNEWMPDRNMSGTTDGHADFPLGSAPVTTPAQPELPRVSPAYLDWLHDSYACMELLGYDQQQGRAITLEHVYCPAVTVPEHDGLKAAEDQAQVQQDKDAPPALLLTRIGEQSLYLPGPPGAGKSTFCRWAVLRTGPAEHFRHSVPAPEGFEETPPRALREHLPVLIPLRDFWRRMDCGYGERQWNRQTLEQALAHWIDKKEIPGLDGSGLLAHLAAGSAFLLLDGLDEVPISEPRGGHADYPRKLLLSGLQAALPVWERAGNRVLLTSRPYGLDETSLARLGLTRTPLEPVPEPLQTLFVRRWFHALNQVPLGEELLIDIAGRQELTPLLGNPMLLTALCVIYGNGKRLPRDRHELYRRIIENVLYNRYPEDDLARKLVFARLRAIAYDMHTGERIGTPRATPLAEIGWSEVERSLRKFAGINPGLESGQVQPKVQREELLIRSGLLLPRGDNRAAFYHLSFQEFLAAEYLYTEKSSAELESVFVERGAFPEWHPTLWFLFSALFADLKIQPALDLLQRLAGRLTRASVKANASPAVLVAELLGLTLDKKYRPAEALDAGFRTRCLDAIADEVPARERLALGLCLGRLGDPRVLDDLRDQQAYVEVPAGDYPYGEEGERVNIPRPFPISRYLVTNGQYRAFVEDKGYRNAKWWSDAGWAWRGEDAVEEPVFWNDRHWNPPICRWWGSRFGRPRRFAPGPVGACRASRSGRPPPGDRRVVSIPGAVIWRMASATVPRRD